MNFPTRKKSTKKSPTSSPEDSLSRSSSVPLLSHHDKSRQQTDTNSTSSIEKKKKSKQNYINNDTQELGKIIEKLNINIIELNKNMTTLTTLTHTNYTKTNEIKISFDEFISSERQCCSCSLF